MNAAHLINTPLQRGGRMDDGSENRFNGFSRAVETVETVLCGSATPDTSLKRGVNEKPRFDDSTLLTI